jgi:hypothetical protein
MKAGLRYALLTAGLAGAGYLFFFGDPVGGDSGIAEPSSPRGESGSSSSSSTSKETRASNEVVEILELRPRVATAIKGNSLFATTAWVTPPKPAPAPPPPPPRAPQLPFSFIGKRFDGARWEVYVSRGAETLILHENDVVDGTYKVEQIRPPQLSVVYLPLNEKQSLAIGPAE